MSDFTVVLTVPHAVCVDKDDRQCDPGAEHVARLLEANIKELLPHAHVETVVCPVKRQTEGDCNRADETACIPWQAVALEATAKADVHIDVHTCNDRKIYTLTHPDQFTSRNRVQKEVTRRVNAYFFEHKKENTDNIFEVKKGSWKNYMLVRSRCKTENKLLVEFSNNLEMNEDWVGLFARAVCSVYKPAVSVAQSALHDL